MAKQAVYCLFPSHRRNYIYIHSKVNNGNFHILAGETSDSKKNMVHIDFLQCTNVHNVSHLCLEQKKQSNFDIKYLAIC